VSVEPSNDDTATPTVDDGTPEPAAEPAPLAEGEVIVRLVTEVGEADIRVPPLKQWRSSARNALFSRGDDLAWAIATLSTEDAQTWTDLDPTKGETEIFFEAWGKASGSSNRADRRARRGNLRAVS
jgi:hypothetical protein